MSMKLVSFPALLPLRNTLTEYQPAVSKSSGRALRARHSRTVVLVVFASCFLFHAISGAQVKEIRRVLILNDLGMISSPGFAEVDQAVLSGLQQSPYRIELYQESLQLTFFPDTGSQRAFRESLMRKYSQRVPDLIIAAGSASIKFIAESHESFIRKTPVIFCVLLGAIPDQFESGLHVTGVLGRLRPEETLKAALHLLPGTKHVVVVGGMGKFDEGWERAAKQAFQNYESKLDFIYLTDLTMPVLLQRLKHLPSNTIVYYTSLSQDAAGERFIGSAQSVPLVASAANAPVFVMDDVDLRAGTVGGDLVNWADDARVAAEMAVRVLNGERPEDIPVVMSNNTYMFDWRALKRWGIKERALPPGSIELNRQPSFWEANKQYVLAGLFVLLAQSVAIFALLWQRERRRKAEAELRRSEEKFSKAFRRSPLAFTLASLFDYRFVEVNDTFEQYTGWRRDEVIGRTPLDLKIWVDTNQRSTFIEQLRAQCAVRNMEILFRKKDGQVWTGLVSSELVDLNGEPCALSLITDITVRKEAEEALAGVSRKLVAVQEEERTRIARDLHDDIQQRLAMLAVEIEQLKDGSPNFPAELSRRLSEVWEGLTEVSASVQSISHELHSPQLEYLGIAAAMKSFCREFAARQSVQVDFRIDNIPQPPSHEVSLCLFRVLQEALHNATKYSQVRHFEVRLTCAGDQLDLTVADQGIGFDPETAMNKGGLGLVSMCERVRLVNGTIAIDSKPMTGTTIHVRVPFGSKPTSRRAAV
jgi:PAS domain S-box-containing protein